MKKQLTIAAGALVLMCGAFTQAYAQVAPCTGTAGAAVASLDAKTDGTTFVREAMQFKCSANVYLSANQDTAKAWVAAASLKGKYYWGGNTDGGSATKLGTAGSEPTVTSGTAPTPSDHLSKALAASGT